AAPPAPAPKPAASQASKPAPKPAAPPAPKAAPAPAPKAPPAPAPKPAPAAPTYTVQSGDTLSGIAQRALGAAGRWTDIFNLNRDQISNPNVIHPGQVLKLPSGSKPVPAPAPAPKSSSSAPSGPAPSGNVGSWINQAMTILEQHGVPASKLNANDINTIIMHESSGNPRAQNNWDSNAAAGHPSKGLMQTIDPTFNAYALPGHTDIWNPVDNIIAGVRYAISRYGSIQNVPGIKALAAGRSYVGY
ncbi:MAG TPA: LysM peptidoglycan-binding domain-containing protein, partial [Oscillatoriaceae cyanobacterium]